VKRITLGALLKPESRLRIPTEEDFYFCRTPTCQAVYFKPDTVIFRKRDMAVKVGLKEANDPMAPVCYCFGWTPKKIQDEIKATGKSTAVDEIKAQVKRGNCYCEITNPQGSCCLGNVTKAVTDAFALFKHNG